MLYGRSFMKPRESSVRDGQDLIPKERLWSSRECSPTIPIRVWAISKEASPAVGDRLSVEPAASPRAVPLPGRSLG